MSAAAGSWPPASLILESPLRARLLFGFDAWTRTRRSGDRIDERRSRDVAANRDSLLCASGLGHLVRGPNIGHYRPGPGSSGYDTTADPSDRLPVLWFSNQRPEKIHAASSHAGLVNRHDVQLTAGHLFRAMAVF